MVDNSENRVIYKGDGVATEFPFEFLILAKSNIKVLLARANGSEELLTDNYYVDQEKGVVVYPGYPPGAEPPESQRPAKLKSGEQLVIYREVPINQLSKLPSQYPFDITESAADKLTIISQQLSDGVSRSMRVSETADFKVSPIVPVAKGKSFRWADDGLSLEVTEDPAVVMVQATATLSATQEQRQLVINKSAEAVQAANNANAAKNRAVQAETNAANSAGVAAETVAAGIASINTAKDSAIGDIAVARDNALGALETKRVQAVDSVNSAGSSNVSSVNQAGSATLSNIDTAKDTAVGSINTAKDSAVSEMGSIRDSVNSSVQTAEAAATSAGVSASTATTARNEAVAAKDIAVGKANYISGYAEKLNLIDGLQQTVAQQTVDIAELQMHTFRVNTDGSVTMIIKEASEL